MPTTPKVYTAVSGKPYGHHPGNTYRDVHGELTQTRYGWRCLLTEVWGSCQGPDEEHGRVEASGRADDPMEAILLAKREARELEMDKVYVSSCTNQLMKAIEDDEEEE